MDEFKRIAIECAKEAGAIALSMSHKKIEFQMKGAYDILAEADLKSEHLIVEKIKAAFPDHSILSEENADVEKVSPYTWVIDPVDGTINFERHINEYCVSIALEKDGELLLGVIYQPAYDKLFVASIGEGAFLNDKKISVSQENNLINTLFSTENSSKLDVRMGDFQILLDICQKVRGVRIFGSGALHLAALAEGHIDFYFKTKFNYWDIAAGVVLIREAGGKVTDMDGSDLLKTSPNIVASNNILHSEVLQLLRK